MHVHAHNRRNYYLKQTSRYTNIAILFRHLAFMSGQQLKKLSIKSYNIATMKSGIIYPLIMMFAS